MGICILHVHHLPWAAAGVHTGRGGWLHGVVTELVRGGACRPSMSIAGHAQCSTVHIQLHLQRVFSASVSQ